MVGGIGVLTWYNIWNSGANYHPTYHNYVYDYGVQSNPPITPEPEFDGTEEGSVEVEISEEKSKEIIDVRPRRSL